MGQYISVNSLVKKIIKISKRSLLIKHDKSFNFLNTFVKLNYKLANKELGWKPRMSLDKGIEKTIKWYKSHYIK